MKKVLLSFDVEEFDMPRERGGDISLEEGVQVSAEGLEKILDLCKKMKVKATFFCTGNFAKNRPELIKRMVKDGHEVACHGVDHFKPERTDIENSKKIVEKVAGAKVFGYRQPRMQKINYKELVANGYEYDSSVNPAFIPGRYNHLDVPRKPFKKDGIIEVPTSVATFARVPLFWLALHLFPLKIYMAGVKMSLKKTGYFATYFHPWEFADLTYFDIVPSYIKHNSGDKLVFRLEYVIGELKKYGCDFVCYKDFANSFTLDKN